MRKFKKSEWYYTYVLLCADKSYYVGITNNIERRLHEHKSAKNPTSYTARRLPVELLHFEKYQYVWNAIHREKQLKRWIRNKKESLIRNDIETLKKLSTRKQKFTVVTKTRWNLRRKMVRKTIGALSD